MSLSLTDCVFFLRGQCTKGSDCPFRHADAARTNPVPCRYWLQDACANPDCRFRHPTLPTSVDGSRIFCHFQASYGHCEKNAAGVCLFAHAAPRRASANASAFKKRAFSAVPGVDSARKLRAAAAQDDAAPDRPRPKPADAAEADAGAGAAAEEEAAPEESLAAPRLPPPRGAVVPAASGASAARFGVKTLEQLRVEKTLVDAGTEPAPPKARAPAKPAAPAPAKPAPASAEPALAKNVPASAGPTPAAAAAVMKPSSTATAAPPAAALADDDLDDADLEGLGDDIDDADLGDLDGLDDLE